MPNGCLWPAYLKNASSSPLPPTPEISQTFLGGIWSFLFLHIWDIAEGITNYRRVTGKRKLSFLLLGTSLAIKEKKGKKQTKIIIIFLSLRDPEPNKLSLSPFLFLFLSLPSFPRFLGRRKYIWRKTHCVLSSSPLNFKASIFCDF